MTVQQGTWRISSARCPQQADMNAAPEQDSSAHDNHQALIMLIFFGASSKAFRHASNSFGAPSVLRQLSGCMTIDMELQPWGIKWASDMNLYAA